LERTKPARALAGVAVNTDQPSILTFGFERQGDKSHTADKKERFRGCLDMIV
jgi:hypothetical protein